MKPSLISPVKAMENLVTYLRTVINLLDRFKVFPSEFLMILFHLNIIYTLRWIQQSQMSLFYGWRFRNVKWLAEGHIIDEGQNYKSGFLVPRTVLFLFQVRQTTIKVKWINIVLRLEILSLLLFTFTVLNMENGKHTSKSI